MTRKILYFGATWCGMCQVVKQHLENVTEVTVEKYDVDEDEEKAEEYDITSVPTLIFLNDNNEVETTLRGAVTFQQIQENINH